MPSPTSAQYIGYATLVANLQTIIQASSYVRPENVYTFAPPNFSGYPAVIIAPRDEKAMAADTTRNQYTFAFDVLVLQTRLNLDADQTASYSDAENAMRVLVDDLTLKLNADLTVGGLISTFSRPVSHKWGYIKSQDSDTRSCTISIEVVVGQ